MLQGRVMKILISGASGLVGAALVSVLRRDGHDIVTLGRSSSRDGDGMVSWNPDLGRVNLGSSTEFDAVVHLAGEPIAQRWTPEVKRRIRDSRVLGTRLLAETLVRLPHPPTVMICASATGFYGSRADEWLDESSAPGTGFLADVVRDWEIAAAPALSGGIRVVALRFGLVLSAQGGALKKMLPAFRFGAGGRIADGRAWWSWVTLGDVVEVVRFALVNAGLRGPVNVVTPHPVTNAEFTAVLGRVLRRPTVCPVPRFAIELLFGEMGREALLSSFRVRPSRLMELGFQFRQPALEPALQRLLNAEGA